MPEDSSKLKQTIITSAIIVFLISVALAIFCESWVQKFYPGFSSVLYLSSIIFFGGLGYTILDRKLIIGLLAVLLSALVPFMQKWLVGYWDWLSQYIHNFL